MTSDLIFEISFSTVLDLHLLQVLCFSNPQTSLCRVNTFCNNSGVSDEESPLWKTRFDIFFINGKKPISLALVVYLKPSLSVSCLCDRKRGLFFL